MRFFRGKIDEIEKLFQSFVSDLKIKEFDLMVFDKRQIKKCFGRGMYEIWEESLRALRHRKIIIIFREKELRVSWVSDDYPDRVVINMARSPDKEIILKTEEDLLRLLALEGEVS